MSKEGLTFRALTGEWCSELLHRSHKQCCRFGHRDQVKSLDGFGRQNAGTIPEELLEAAVANLSLSPVRCVEGSSGLRRGRIGLEEGICTLVYLNLLPDFVNISLIVIRMLCHSHTLNPSSIG